MLEQQNEQNRVLLPFLAAEEGFDVTTDDRGVITSISKRQSHLDEQNEEIAELLNERTLAALRGELPVDPALEQSLEGQEEEIRTRLRAQFGPGYETSTPGIETLSEFFQSAEALREAARTGQLTLAEQLGITRQQQEIFARQSGQDVLRTAAVSDPLAFAGALGQVAGGFGQAQIPYMHQRQLAAQQKAAKQKNKTSFLGSALSAAGSIIGGAFAFSFREIKDDFVRISETKDGIPLYVFTRKDTGERLIGVIADEVENVRPDSIYTKEGYDVVSYRSLE